MALKLGLIALASACLLPAPAFAAEAAAAKPAAAAHKMTPDEIKAYQHHKGLKETGIMDATTKKAYAADKAACKLPGQGGTLDLSDPCNSGQVSTTL
jgi:hypothetical protein